jgi:isoquinoline 1-oxidoreductase alpha subunit
LEESAGSSITTIEGLPDEHPIKQAWIEHQVPQCGYCQPGIMLQAVDFLTRVPNPTETQINQAMDDVICRCGSHARMKVALKDAVNTLNQKQGG